MHGPECGRHRRARFDVVQHGYQQNRPVAWPARIPRRRIGFGQPCAVRQSDRTSIQHKQPVVQCVGRASGVQAPECLLSDAARRLHRQIHSCLPVGPGVRRNAPFPYLLTRFEQFLTAALSQLLDRRLQRPHRRQTLLDHQPDRHRQRKDTTVTDDLQIPLQIIEELRRHHLSKPAQHRSRRMCRRNSSSLGLIVPSNVYSSGRKFQRQVC